jgi:hypothetical protein
MATRNNREKAPDEPISVRLTLTGQDHADFMQWCERMNAPNAWVATHMVRYFIRAFPPGDQLPALPDRSQPPLL